MEESKTFKPIVWRLIIWGYIPFFTGWAIAVLIDGTIDRYFNYTLQEAIIAFALGAIAISIVLAKKLIIRISEGKISGPSTTSMLWNEKTTFSIADFDKASIHERSFYEKISGLHRLRSVDGQKIIFAHFIYGESAVSEIYKILEREQLQSPKP
jgi:hypothetical protein